LVALRISLAIGNCQKQQTGFGALPLLMDKSTGPGEFFALEAVDRLARLELQVTQGGDAGRSCWEKEGLAIETVQQWVQIEG
jgi:hypothetical protein